MAAGISNCLEGTRVDVLTKIVTWFSDGKPGIFWLNGMAGYGKSTIAKSIAHTARVSGQLGASFFISRRADIRLRDPAAIVPTIAYQLADYNREYMTMLVNTTDEHNDIAALHVGEQIDILLREPLMTVTGSMMLPVVVIDAFDELDGTGAHRLLHTLLSDLAMGSPLPLKLLITSRPETFIRNTFSYFQSSTRLLLHNIEETIVKADIQLYLEASLARIPFELGLPLSPPWFQSAELSALLEASGNLFVYAATAVRFVGNNPPAKPRSQLRKLLSHSGGSASTAHLDSLYLEVLDGIAKAGPEFTHEFRLIVGSMILLRDTLSVLALEALLGFAEPTAYSALMTIHSLIIYPNDPSGTIRFYHPSVPEFFIDSARCTNPALHIDASVYEAYLAGRCLMVIEDSRTIDLSQGAGAAALLYSCAHWASHVFRAPIGYPKLAQLVDSFGRTDFLRWLEIVSSQNIVPIAIKALQDAEGWAVRESP